MIRIESKEGTLFFAPSAVEVLIGPNKARGPWVQVGGIRYDLTEEQYNELVDRLAIPHYKTSGAV